MQISCPTCSTRYNLPDHSVPASGRKVRCKQCGHTWMQFPQVVEEDTFERTALFTDGPGDDFNDRTEVRPIRTFSAAPSVHAEKKPRRALPVGWLALAASLLAVVAGGVVARQQIVHLWPPANLLYKTAGLAVLPPGAGLQLQNPHSEHRQEAGAAILVVEGQIVNVSDQPQSVPRVKALALDAQQNLLQTWIIDASATSLQPGEIATFFSAQRDPGPVALLKLTFDADAKLAGM